LLQRYDAPVKSSGTTRREFAAQAALGLGLVAAADPIGRALGAASFPEGGPVAARIEGRTLTLSNDLVRAEWEVRPTGLRIIRVEDRRGAGRLEAGRGAFAVQLAGGTLLDSGRMELKEGPRVEELPASPRASRLSERVPGRQITLALEDDGGRARVVWRAVLREGSHYVRQEVELSALGADLPVTEVCLIDLAVPDAAVRGTVKGSPVTAGPWFFGLEHPLSASTAGQRVLCSLERALPLRAGQSAACSSVIGVAADGQMRRDFLRYVEHERAHPYRTFLHYNSWYDLGYFTPFDEGAAVAVIEAFGRELHARRGVTLDSFLFDDGWDDHRLWGFNGGFPKGFGPLRDASARFGAAPGVWLSPWGGYGKPRQERLDFGREQGFEANEEGLALSGPVYYRRFREVCLEMIRRYGVNQFKLDGTGSSAKVVPGSAFGSDFEAAIALIGDLRAEKPDLFVNLTTGTYPSPFWLRHADSIWRGGEDHEFAGVGSDRQRWITYRDADTFAHVVQTGPLYPLNALMLHGLIFAKHAKKLDTDPKGDFDAEIRSYFGSGTQLQEMYVTHSLLSEANWDALAEAAKWSRSSAATLADTHWVGGDPARLEIYGWAAWKAGRAILTLRNPSDRAQVIAFDAASVFELPAGSPGRFQMTSPWKKDAGRKALQVEPGKRTAFGLEPFEVRTLTS
jgi:hypothetical protein